MQPCPRCLGGQMVPDGLDDASACLNCGHRVWREVARPMLMVVNRLGRVSRERDRDHFGPSPKARAG